MKHTVSLTSKLPSVGTSIFSVMSAMAREEEAVNLSQGFPDFDPAPELLERVSWHLQNQGNQYAPAAGAPALRQQISRMVREFYGTEYHPESEITVTSGATEALYDAITTVVNPGDEVIIFEPAYDSYVPAIELNGGIPVFISLRHPTYHIDWEEVKKRVTRKTKLIILNSPHNPTGSVLGRDDIAELTKLVKDSEIFILSDEVYEHIIFDGLRHESMARYPELASRSFIVSSFGKSFHCTGWKVGYCLAPEGMTSEFRKIHQFMTFSTSHPFQLGIADFMQNLDWLENLGPFYQQKRDLFLEAIKGSRFEPLKCRGTYFQMLSYKGVSEKKDTEFAEELTRAFKLASIPVSVFYHQEVENHVLRFCFAKSDETLHKGAEILRSI